jgi:hypothetical protein
MALAEAMDSANVQAAFPIGVSIVITCGSSTLTHQRPEGRHKEVPNVHLFTDCDCEPATERSNA